MRAATAPSEDKRSETTTGATAGKAASPPTTRLEYDSLRRQRPSSERLARGSLAVVGAGAIVVGGDEAGEAAAMGVTVTMFDFSDPSPADDNPFFVGGVGGGGSRRGSGHPSDRLGPSKAAEVVGAATFSQFEDDDDPFDPFFRVSGSAFGSHVETRDRRESTTEEGSFVS